ncbi:Uncharacterized protein FWK35_00022400 [Aphis craccivora]|uniref:T-box domain-containing protein n=1 Tax=Aphis craccivora TaxID=307492 RepID=A0A6G0YDA1_APHCR|nr:Uncharacterized protein FWK35_00022400 [Aphis craccivora]
MSIAYYEVNEKNENVFCFFVFVSFLVPAFVDGKPLRKRRLSSDTMVTIRSSRDSPADEIVISSSTSSPPPPSVVAATTPANPVLEERCNSEELQHVSCRLETKDLWDKFNELGTEMIITKTGRSVNNNNMYYCYHIV